MRKSFAYVLLWALVAVVGCGAQPKAKPVVKVTPPGKIGDSCKPSGEGMTQGNCEKGLVCEGSAPGGYCTAMCPCGAGATCAESSETPEVCLKSCSSDTNCRVKDGYGCDPTWKVCALPNTLAAKAPMCEPPAPPLPRKTFGKVVQLSSSKAGGKNNLEPSAALAKNGDLIAVYVAGSPAGAPNGLATSRVVDDVAVEGGEIKLDRENHLDPWLAADRAGKLYMSFLAFDGGSGAKKHMMIGVASSDDGINWSKAVVANDANDCAGDAAGCLDKPMIAIGPDPDPKNAKNDVIYVFYYSATQKSLRVTHSTDKGATFTPSTAVGDGTVADVLVTKTGKLHVVYVGGGGNKMGDAGNALFYTKSGDVGATWAPPKKVSGQGESLPMYFSSPQLLADLDKLSLYVVYPVGTPDGKWDIILATSKDGGETWTRATINDDGPCANHMAPTAILDPTGKVYITWFDNRSGKGSLAFASCASGGIKCTPNELVSDTPFASYGFARESTKWLGDYNSLVVDPKKKVLHAVWTQSVEENGAPVGRVFTSSAKLK